MPPDDDIVRLRHMLDAAKEAYRFLQGRSPQDLATDTMLNYAVRHAIEIIGEAANNVSPDVRNLLPDIPWRKVIGMRNRLIHAYFDVNATILWDTVKLSLPELITALTEYLADDSG